MSRAFGDIEAKHPRYQGNPSVVIATPDIKSFKIKSDYDFILMGSDGIFDRMSNQKVLKVAWEASRLSFYAREQPLHPLPATCVESVMKAAVGARSSDNITVLMICFKNYKKQLRYDLANHQRSLGKYYKPEDYVLLETERNLIK